MDTLSDRPPSGGRLPSVVRLATLVGGVMAAAMSFSLLLAVVARGPDLYQAELRSFKILSAAFQGEPISGVLFAAAWVPVVICVLAFAIVVAGVAIVIWTTWVQRALAWISAQAAICPTLPWWQRSMCWAAVAGAVAALSAALGLFFTAAAVVLINVLVVLIGLAF